MSGAHHDEQAYLQTYDASSYDLPAVAVDVVALSHFDRQLRVLLVRRDKDPFAGAWSLPGTYLHVDRDETLQDACRRCLQHKAKFPAANDVQLWQVHTRGIAERDPRERVISVVHVAFVDAQQARFTASVADDSVHWAAVDDVNTLAFDHVDVVDIVRREVAAHVDTVGFALAPAPCSWSQLRAVHESVLQRTLDNTNFRRRFAKLEKEGVVDVQHKEEGRGTLVQVTTPLFDDAGPRPLFPVSLA